MLIIRIIINFQEKITMENNAFTKPQRQSQIGIVLLTLINFGKVLKNFWPLLVFYFLKDKTPDGLMFASTIIGCAVFFFVVISYFQYRNFTYFINLKTDEFIINRGIITKKKISIERNKIQEININQPFFHKLLSIYQLEIDSPGSDKKEVTVNAISHENAIQLKQYLLERKYLEDTENQVAEGIQDFIKHPPIKISAGSLVKYGLTANYLKSFITFIAFGFYIFQQAVDFFNKKLFQDWITEAENWEQELNGHSFQNFTFLTFFAVILLVLIFGILVNVIVNLFKYFGMKISKNKDSFSVEFGLLNTKNSIVGRKKIQMVTEMQNYLQKRLNVLQLKFNQISDNEHNKNNYTIIPGCSESEKKDVLCYIWNEIPKFKYSLKPNIRKLIFGNIFFIVLPVFISILAKSVLGNVFWLVFLYVIIAEIILFFSFRNYRLLFNEKFIRIRFGIWDIEQKTIEIHKIQSVKISQYFWQKKSDLGSVTFFTAGGKISFKSTKYSVLRKLVNFSIFKVENSGKNWM